MAEGAKAIPKLDAVEREMAWRLAEQISDIVSGFPGYISAAALDIVMLSIARQQEDPKTALEGMIQALRSWYANPLERPEPNDRSRH